VTSVHFRDEGENSITMKKFLFFIALVFLSCQANMESKQEAVDSTLAATDLPATDLYSDGTGQLIKTADVRFQVNDLKKSREAIEISIRKHSAYIEETNLTYENPLLEEHFTIRVQSQSFEPLLKELESLAAYVNHRKVKSDDVAKAFVDLESRLKTKREMEQRYIQILRNATKTTDDILRVERQLGELHEEIEAVVSKLNFLRDQVKHSTIKLDVYQIDEQHMSGVTTSPDLKTRVGVSLLSGWNGLTFLFVGFLKVWPVWILLGLAWLVWKKKWQAV
jgi:hypothetical protein